MNAIEKQLSGARAIVGGKVGFLKEGKIPGVYRGYVSSFGVDVRQLGVLPTVLLYKATDANTREQDGRGKVIKAIWQLMPQQYASEKAFIDDVYDKRNRLRRDVMNAAVALKLAMRTFPFEDNQD